MRLLASEIHAIKNILKKYSPQGTIYLHGSRLNDQAKGGDIDLFWVLPDHEYGNLKTEKYKIKSRTFTCT